MLSTIEVDRNAVEFRAAVKALSAGFTHDEIADVLGASFYSVKQALLPSDSPAYRSPPPGWQKALSKLARKRGGDLAKLADQLDREAQ